MRSDALQKRVGQRVEEQLRRASAESTRRIALRYGDSMEMMLGSGFPKSGTVWLCQLMSTYLGVPYPRNYRLPIAMASVIHSHWPYDERFPPAAYISRDGRDVMVSMYFYYVRALTLDKSPRRKKSLREFFHQLYGSRFDPEDSRGNMARFIEHELAKPRATHGVTWHEHITDWWDRPRVHHTSYEALLKDTPGELSRLMGAITGETSDMGRVRAAVDRYAFRSSTGRGQGVEDRSSFLRKGVAGDWRNHFDRDAAEVFDGIAGDALVTLGYEDDRSWVTRVT